MFGRNKKEKDSKDIVIDCMHYEGIPGFPTDRPVYVTIQSDKIDVKFKKGDGHTSLPFSRISTVETLQDKFFVEKYKAILAPMAMKNAVRWFMVITYDKGRIVFWALSGKSSSLMIDFAAKFSSGVGEVEL